MKTLIIAGLLLASPALMAKDLGVMGNTYPLKEIDMLDWIMARLHKYEHNGEMAHMQQQFKARVKHAILRPQPVKGLTTTTTPKRFFVDPTLTLAKDILDANGKVLFKKGLKINPFDSRSWPNGQQLPRLRLSKQLVFFDGDDKRALNFAKRYQRLEAKKPNPLAIKWILVNGEPNKVAKALGQRVYFDQHGNITRRLHIKHIPSVAKQHSTQWEIQEFDINP